ncbi:hypothetical protein HYS97_03585 [Candidatus Daviesbacteria bacterium]|nr:hypothetical protein [Candidatus Daviesbacteria bacterium]
MANYRIRFSHVCETAIIDKMGRLSVINIFENINASQLPAIHSQLAVVGSLYFKGDKKNRPDSCNIGVTILNPGNKEIFSVSQNLPLSDNDSGFVFLIQALQFTEKGEHNIEISADGHKIENIKLNLLMAKQGSK